jgi:hypothetical protein
VHQKQRKRYSKQSNAATQLQTKQNLDSTNPHIHTHTNQSQHPKNPARQTPHRLTMRRDCNPLARRRVSTNSKTEFQIPQTKPGFMYIPGRLHSTAGLPAGLPHTGRAEHIPHSLIPKPNVEWNPKVEWFAWDTKRRQETSVQSPLLCPSPPVTQSTNNILEGREEGRHSSSHPHGHVTTNLETA